MSCQKTVPPVNGLAQGQADARLFQSRTQLRKSLADSMRDYVKEAEILIGF